MKQTIGRLGWPFAISLGLHLCVGGLLSLQSAESMPRRAKVMTLTVILPGKASTEPSQDPLRNPSTTKPADSVVPAVEALAETEGKLTQKARFLTPPDLSVLEEIAVPFSGSVIFRLHVTPMGIVDRVTVIKSDPVPKELLDGLQTRLGQAQLAPALSGSQPVASTLDLVIRYEPAPTPLKREP